MAWGDSSDGGDISVVKAQFDQGIEHVWSKHSAFLVQLESCEFVAWGDRNDGGDISAVKAQLEQGIEHI